MNLKLTPSIISLNGKYVETYERQSRATTEAKVAAGLTKPEDQNIKASVGIASVSEYIVASAYGLQTDVQHYLDLQQFGQALQLDSIYVASPAADSVTIQIADVNRRAVFSKILDANQTPYQFPAFVVTEQMITFSLTPNTNVDYVQVVFRPVGVLATPQLIAPEIL